MSQISTIPSKPRHLVQQLMRDIAEQQLEPGDRLGTENDLIERYGQTRAIVRQALGVLEQHGIVSRRQRMGTYIERRIDTEEAARPFRGSIVLTITGDHASVTPDTNLARYILIHSTLDALNDIGFTTQTVSLRGDGQRDEQLFAAAMQTVDLEGIIFLGEPPDQALLCLVPDVPCAGSVPTTDSYSVTVADDARQRIARLTNYLIDHGHTDIAVLCGSDLDNAALARVMAGYRNAFESRGLRFRRQRVAMAYADEPLTDLAMQMICESPPPTAIIADGPMLCHAAIHAAAQLGRGIGDDLSLIGCGMNILQIPTDLKLTAYIPDYAALGRHLGRAMQQIIDNEIKPPVIVKPHGEFVEGNTVKDLTATRA